MPKTLKGISEFFNWSVIDNKKITGNIEWIENFASILKNVPKEVRKLCLITFEHAKEETY